MMDIDDYYFMDVDGYWYEWLTSIGNPQFVVNNSYHPEIWCLLSDLIWY
jgi:hypothetical protein